VSNAILSKISGLPELQRLVLEYTLEEGLWRKFDPLPSQSALHRQRERKGWFPSLDHLHFSGSVHRLEKFVYSFAQKNHPASYLSIKINLKMTELTNSQIWNQLPSCFSFIEKLDLDCADSYDTPLTYSTLSPFTFTKCEYLTSLRVYGSGITTTELDDFLDFWPNLTTLLLASGLEVRYSSFQHIARRGIPLQDTEPDGLGLDVLDVIAKKLPAVEDLTLTISTYPTYSLPISDLVLYKLRSLKFLASFTNFDYPGFEMDKAAKYIVSVVPPNVDLSIDGCPLLDYDIEDPENPRIQYLRKYNAFVDAFNSVLDSYMDIRLDD
jgi:hypothetical protein